jgi:hypothetical protein
MASQIVTKDGCVACAMLLRDLNVLDYCLTNQSSSLRTVESLTAIDLSDKKGDIYQNVAEMLEFLGLSAIITI